MEQIALVDQSERFVFKPMLYELLSGGMKYYIYGTTAVFFDSNMFK
jgi:NADH dehydrogenase FAD-containing subunit